MNVVTADAGMVVSRRTVLMGAAATAALWLGGGGGGGGGRASRCFAQPAPVDNRAQFFKVNKVTKIVMTIKPADLATMKTDPKKYVRAILRENDRAAAGEVGIRMKGTSTEP